MTIYIQRSVKTKHMEKKSTNDFRFIKDRAVKPAKMPPTADVAEFKKNKAFYVFAYDVDHPTITRGEVKHPTIPTRDEPDRTLLIADYDDLDGIETLQDLADGIKSAIGDVRMVLYTSISNGHKGDGLRARAVIDIDRPINKMEYEIICKYIQHVDPRLKFDESSNRNIQGLPVDSGHYSHLFITGPQLDIDGTIGKINDEKMKAVIENPPVLDKRKKPVAPVEKTEPVPDTKLSNDMIVQHMEKWVTNHLDELIQPQSQLQKVMKCNLAMWVKNGLMDYESALHQIDRVSVDNPDRITEWKGAVKQDLDWKSPENFFNLGIGERERDRFEKLSPLAVAQVSVEKLEVFNEGLAYDEFLKQYVFLQDPRIFGINKQIGDVLNFSKKSTDLDKISHWFTKEFGKAIPAKTWESAIKGGVKKTFDSAINWLTLDENGEPLKWDGTDYIGNCLVNILHCEDTPLNHAILRGFICNLLNRGINGKYHEVFYKFALILYGKQDAGKSQFLKKLGGDFFSNELNKFGLDSPRVNTQLKKNIVVELGETGFFKKNDMEDIKQFITTDTLKTNDFGDKDDEIFWCRHVIGISANMLEFIKDSTGSARFYSLEVAHDVPSTVSGSAIYNMTTQDVKNLFAQGLHILKTTDLKDAISVPEEFHEELEASRLDLQYKGECFPIIQEYTEMLFPDDTFQTIDQFTLTRHKNDIEFLTYHKEWDSYGYTEQFQKIDRNARLRNPEGFYKIERISIKELIHILDLVDESENQKYLKQDIESALSLLGFKKYKGRKLSHSGKKCSDIWERQSMVTGSGVKSNFKK